LKGLRNGGGANHIRREKSYEYVVGVDIVYIYDLVSVDETGDYIIVKNFFHLRLTLDCSHYGLKNCNKYGKKDIKAYLVMCCGLPRNYRGYEYRAHLDGTRSVVMHKGFRDTLGFAWT